MMSEYLVQSPGELNCIYSMQHDAIGFSQQATEWRYCSSQRDRSDNGLNISYFALGLDQMGSSIIS